MKRLLLLSLLLLSFVSEAQMIGVPLEPITSATIANLSALESLSSDISSLLLKPDKGAWIRCTFVTRSEVPDLQSTLNQMLDLSGVGGAEVSSVNYMYNSTTEGMLIITFSPLPAGVNNLTFRFFTRTGSLTVSLIEDNDGILDTYELTGRQVCSGLPDIAISQPGSQPGVAYTLLRDGASVISRNGTGDAVSFGSYDTPGTYSVRARLLGWENVNYGNVVISSNASSGLGGANYILERTYTTDNGDNFRADVTYLNGFGHPEQEIALDGAPDGRSLVTPVVYDLMKRPDATVNLPFPYQLQNGRYLPDAVQRQREYYAGDSHPYETNTFESGLEGRLISSQKPGAIYRENSRKVTVEYGVNDGTEGVMDLRYSSAGSVPVIIRDGVYGKDRLRLTMTVTEDCDTSYVFTDIFDKTVLTREVTDGINHDTYFIYDLKDRLVCVIQPEGSAQVGTSFTFSGQFCSNYCFTYTYDERDNIIEKQIPGAGKQVLAYDLRDRQILYADAKMMEAGKYKYTLYDTMDRVIQEGYSSLSNSIVTVRAAQMTNVPLTSFLTDPMVTRTLSYYDGTVEPPLTLPGASRADKQEIDFTHCLTLPATEQIFEEPHIEGTGLARGDRVRTKAYFYDSKGRMALMTETDSDGWKSIYSWKYDFQGNVLRQTEEHYKDNAFDSIVTTYTYDNRGRRLTLQRNLNGTDYAAVTYSYDDLGRLDGKEVAGRGSESYAYTLQGWQKETTAIFYGQGVFTQTMSYQLPQMTLTKPRFDGMVSEISYCHLGLISHTLGYSYDGLKRLRDTRRHPMGNQATLDIWTERNLTYDRNGNLTSMRRLIPETGGTYTLTYSGNRIQSLTKGETTSSYTYYSDGNLKTDSRRDLQFQYNLLNLPATVTDASGQTLKASYSYLADGTKLTVRDSQNDGLTYRGSFVYTADGTPGSTAVTENLESIAHDEGRFVALSPSSGTTTTQFIDTWHVRDYLGSVRTILDITQDETAVTDASAVILEQNDYLPFGTRVSLSAQAYDPSNRYRYNGKEEQVTGSVGLTDYGARLYDNSLPRWTTPDPLAEKYYGISPYAFCNNNPVNFVDPDGRDPIYKRTLFGGVKQIGDDGKNGSVSYLVKRSVARQVKKASKVGQYYKGDLSESDLVIHIPTGNILESVRQSYDDTKDSMKENGGHSVQGNNSAIRWDEGPAATADIDKNGNTVVRATLHMFVVNGINTMPHDASNIQLWWHTHPNVTINGVSLGSSNPSEADYNGQRKMLNRGYNGNSFVIGVRDRRVTFFNGKKRLSTIRWKAFIRMGEQKK